MADLTAKFRLVDEMSDKLSSLAESGQSMFGQWVQAGEEAGAAFDGVASTVTGTATTIDGVATSIENARAEIGEIGSEWERELDAANRAKAGIDEVSASTDILAASMGSYGEAAGEATAQSDYWTEAVGNYNTSALEAIYSTEELVEMGFKSAEALEEQERMFELCEQSATYLSKAIEGSSEIQNELTSSMEQANETISELALSGQSDKTGSTLDMMGGIVNKLNSNYEDFSLTLDKTTGKLDVSTSDLYSYIEKAAEQEKKQAAMDSLTEALSQFGDVKEQSEQAAKEVATAWDNYEALEEKWKGEHPILKNIAAGAEMNWSSDLGVAFDEWEALSEASSKAHGNYEELVGEIKTYCEQLGYSAEETDEFISQLENSAEAAANFSEQMGGTGDEVISISEEFSAACESVGFNLEELCTAYNETYQSALDSFEGQFGLFDEAWRYKWRATRNILSARR